MKRFIATALVGLMIFAGMPAVDAWAAPSAQNLTAQDRTEMNEVVDKYQKSVFDSYFGSPATVPAELFTTTGIQAELNAKNKCTALSRRGSRVVIKESHYEMNDVVKDGDWARFSLTRTLKIETTRDGKTTATNESTVEGYLMKKNDGKWQIENIFINPGERTEAMAAFMATNDLSKFSYADYSIEESSGLDYVELAKKLGAEDPDSPSTPPSSKDVKIVINGTEVPPKDAKPYIKNNRTMIPMRLVSEYLDADVVWDPQDKSITLTTTAGDVYGFAIGRASYAYGSRVVNMDVAPELSDGRTMLPLRAVGEIFGEVVWDATSRTVTINTDGGATAPDGNDTFGVMQSLDGLSDGVAAGLRGKAITLDSDIFVDSTARNAVNGALNRLSQRHQDDVVVAMDLAVKTPNITAHDRFARATIDVDCTLSLMDRNGNTYLVDATLDQVAVLLEKADDGTWAINNAFFDVDSAITKQFKNAAKGELSNYQYSDVPFSESLGI